MKSLFLACATMALAAQVCAATTPALDQETLADIAKHEKISAAHAEAAKCLRAGKPHEVCEAALSQACKGVAIGKFCGMKH